MKIQDKKDHGTTKLLKCSVSVVAILFNSKYQRNSAHPEKSRLLLRSCVDPTHSAASPQLCGSNTFSSFAAARDPTRSVASAWFRAYSLGFKFPQSRASQDNSLSFAPFPQRRAKREFRLLPAVSAVSRFPQRRAKKEFRLLPSFLRFPRYCAERRVIRIYVGAARKAKETHGRVCIEHVSVIL